MQFHEDTISRRYNFTKMQFHEDAISRIAPVCFGRNCRSRGAVLDAELGVDLLEMLVDRPWA
jgi:hypothetical protein